MLVVDAVVAGVAAVIVAVIAEGGWAGRRPSARWLAGAAIVLVLAVVAAGDLHAVAMQAPPAPLSTFLHAVSVGLPLALGGMFLWLPHRRARPRGAAGERQVVLAIGAHPDDLELACGGTLARLAQSGAAVHGLVMSRGGGGGDASRRVAEAESGARLMGLVDIDVLDHPDKHLEGARSAMVADIERAVERWRPAMIFTHSDKDAHQDHVAVHEAVLRAARRHPSILCFESPSATRAFTPGMFVDIEAQLPLKEAAVRAHRDQSGKPYMTGHRVRGLAAFRGAQARRRFAEGFEAVRLELPIGLDAALTPEAAPQTAAVPIPAAVAQPAFAMTAEPGTSMTFTAREAATGDDVRQQVSS